MSYHARDVWMAQFHQNPAFPSDCAQVALKLRGRKCRIVRKFSELNFHLAGRLVNGEVLIDAIVSPYFSSNDESSQVTLRLSLPFRGLVSVRCPCTEILPSCNWISKLGRTGG